MELKAGSRWRSAVCTTEVVIIRSPSQPTELACGGVTVLELGTEPPAGVAIDPDQSEGTLLGKRYIDEVLGIEVLCTKPGTGSLTADGARMVLKEAKPLPSSD
jgi:alcohol dehydrogenase YqhD (iron-dependent ADH family)